MLVFLSGTVQRRKTQEAGAARNEYGRDRHALGAHTLNTHWMNRHTRQGRQQYDAALQGCRFMMIEMDAPVLEQRHHFAAFERLARRFERAAAAGWRRGPARGRARKLKWTPRAPRRWRKNSAVHEQADENGGRRSG